MDRKLLQPSGPVSGLMIVPGSKSITNRALVCAALVAGESLIRNASDSDDTGLMANGLNQLGVLVRKDPEGLVVHGTGGVLTAPKYPIPVANAGTTLRFLLGVSALARGRVVLEGSERMAERPNEDLVAALRGMGVSILHESGTARFEVEGGIMVGGRIGVRGDKSSQFVSSLLLAAPYARGPLVLDVEGGLASAGYVELTVEVMENFGVTVRRNGSSTFVVDSGQRYSKADFTVEADASGASYGFGAVAIAGGVVTVAGLRATSRQADTGFMAILRRMGCVVEETTEGVKVMHQGHLHGIDADMNTMPDVVPTLAAIALFADGATRIRNVAHLRHKESDRLRALAEELGRIGAHIKETGDGLEIVASPLHGAVLDPRGDHRLAMSFALIGLRVPGIAIENPECVAKSFPRFWVELDKLREG